LALKASRSLGDAESRPAAGVLEDGVAVETRAAFQHHKPEAAAVLNFHKIQWLLISTRGVPSAVGFPHCAVGFPLEGQQKIYCY